MNRVNLNYFGPRRQPDNDGMKSGFIKTSSRALCWIIIQDRRKWTISRERREGILCGANRAVSRQYSSTAPPTKHTTHTRIYRHTHTHTQTTRKKNKNKRAQSNQKQRSNIRKAQATWPLCPARDRVRRKASKWTSLSDRQEEKVVQNWRAHHYQHSSTNNKITTASKK